MPIEELSRRTGVTVRNLREFQTRGLLEPPLLEGRKGRYSERHLARVVLIRNLQDRGYSLAAISDLLGRLQGALGPLGMMNVENDLATPPFEGQRRMNQPELERTFPELLATRALREQALALELVCQDANGELFAPNAELLETARLLARLGVPLHVQIGDYAMLREEIAVITARLRKRFQQYVVAPLEREGMNPGAIEELASQLSRLRPAIVRSVAFMLSAALERGGPLGAGAVAAPRASKAKKPRGKRKPSPSKRRREAHLE